MKKKNLTIILFVFVVIILVFFIKNHYKKIKDGNNELNKSVKDIESYILNSNSYRATIDVTIYSNKNCNKYIINQERRGNSKIQTIVEPQNIAGVEIKYQDERLEINNSKLGLSEIYSEYPYVSENVLWLDSFISQYKNNRKSIYEDQENVVMEVDCKNDRLFSSKKLYLDKRTGKPLKMEIEYNNEKSKIYISYKDIVIQ